MLGPVATACADPLATAAAAFAPPVAATARAAAAVAPPVPSTARAATAVAPPVAAAFRPTALALAATAGVSAA